MLHKDNKYIKVHCIDDDDCSNNNENKDDKKDNEIRTKRIRTVVEGGKKEKENKKAKKGRRVDRRESSRRQISLYCINPTSSLLPTKDIHVTLALSVSNNSIHVIFTAKITNLQKKKEGKCLVS